jgi:hypothetical protein
MNKPFTAASIASGIALLNFLSPLALQAQDSTPTDYGQDQQGFAAARLSPDALSQILSPIALYPDALTALILPASTVPSDVVLAARYLAVGGDPNQVANQPWDESVKALTHYPDVLAWMDRNLEWTTSLGEAFATQSADVMNAIQALRAQARAAGNLIDTPQQQVVVEDNDIRVLPANPEYIYVPQYDPDVVYTQAYAPDSAPLISFGVGFAVGSWLSYDFDWEHHCFYHGNWNRWNNGGYVNGGGNTVNVITISNNGAAAWQPSANSFRQISQRQHNNGGNVRIARATVQTAAANPQSSANVASFNPARKSSVIPQPSRLAVTGTTITGKSGNAALSVTYPQRQELKAPNLQTGTGNIQSPSTPPSAPAWQQIQEQQVSHHQQSAEPIVRENAPRVDQPIQHEVKEAASVQTRAPKPVQAPKVEPQHHQEAPAPAPATSDKGTKDNKKADEKDKQTP